ncbi:MAG: thymidylate synthase [Patescibacteria group bacterium]|nr:thymidylate synthase [Patescibacteria group bacterium]
MTAFDAIYQKLLKQVMTEGIEELNQRTGHKTRALPGLTFSTDLERDGFPILTLRKIPIRIFVAEQCWFIAGGRKPADFLRHYTKIWDDFTNPGDVVTVAYGYRWRRHFGRDQLAKLIALLKKEPSSRHGVISAWDPGSDGLGGIQKKNVPCPFSFIVNIIGGRLNLHLIIRSNDMILGHPHDVAGFALLAHILAQALKARPGVLTTTISNAHIYDIHYQAAKTLIKRKHAHKNIKLQLPPRAITRAERKDHKLVKDIVENLTSQYRPGEAIKGLKIVL